MAETYELYVKIPRSKEWQHLITNDWGEALDQAHALEKNGNSVTIVAVNTHIAYTTQWGLLR